MTDRPLWFIVLKLAILLAILGAVMGWVGRTRLRPRAPGELDTLRHPWTTLLFGSLGLLFFAAMAVLSVSTSNLRGSLVLAGFALPFVHMLLDYFVARHRLLDDGLSYRKPFGQAGTFSWARLRKIRYSSQLKWFRLETSDGHIVRISAMLVGLPEFARALLESAPPEAMDAFTFAVLRATAAGEPPSLWG